VDPFELLKKDHKKVSGLLKQLDKTEEGDALTREQLFSQLKNELDTHTQIEETIFYPALEEHEETKEIILEAYEEHNAVKTLLKELEETDKSDETWGAKLTVLKENVEHHVEEEEGEMFSKGKEALDKDEIESLGDRINDAKGERKAEGPAEEEEELVNIGAVREIRSARVTRTGGGSASSQPSRLRASSRKRASSKKRSTKAKAGSKKKTSSKKRSPKKKSAKRRW
jgi:Hemerythrin HHE cation binding domain